ncbi:hypothetical protein AB0K93_12275 [Streptomyces sp. NPDC052676]
MSPRPATNPFQAPDFPEEEFFSAESEEAGNPMPGPAARAGRTRAS